jgi:proline-specific peptidase
VRPSALSAVEGYLPIDGHRTWYRMVGMEEDAGKLPMVVLHGGPGMPHDYLAPLASLARGGRRVIFYDQLGCGNSDQSDDASLWTIDRYANELAAVLAALALSRVHLLGHSWGGMLAMEYALRAPATLASLTVASAPASMPQWIAEANRLRQALPPGIQAVLDEHEAGGTTADPAYIAAMLVYYRRHVCRLDPWPEPLNAAMTKLFENPAVYQTMNGPSEFCVVGSLRDWEIVTRLSQLHVPTMVTSGRHDEATPAIAGTVHRLIRGSDWVVFEHSAHMAHLEESYRYNAVLERFMERVEAAILELKEAS